MTKRFLTHEELFDDSRSPYNSGERRLIHLGLHVPYPLHYLVTLDPHTRDVRVTTATLGPLSWRPYTMSANIPLSDEPTVRNLRAEGECVMALPTRDQARQAWIAAHIYAAGINAAEVARLTTFPSRRVQTPGIAECPLNMECLIEYYTEYHGYAIVSLRVLGASLDDAVLPLSREQLTQLYPINYVGEWVHADGHVEPRLAMMGDIAPCPLFPVGHKEGWDTRIASWVADLVAEELVSSREGELVLTWLETYEKLRLDPHLAERKELQHKLTTFSELAAWSEWDALHAFLGIENLEARS
jgi:flavin reductase (DIM6/NTAB) family NADH-FMN oxidoreductase RutF